MYQSLYSSPASALQLSCQYSPGCPGGIGTERQKGQIYIPALSSVTLPHPAPCLAEILHS